MRYVSALAIKFALQLALLALVLPLAYSLTTGALWETALALWIASFLLGDLLVLPAAGAVVAAVADVVLAMVVLMLALQVGITWALFGIGLAVGVVEFFYHDALLAHGFGRSRSHA